MKLSSRSKHGLRAVVELSLNYEQGPVRIQTIAEGAGICNKYIEQLIAPLRASGLVRSIRGFNGGYSLARRPSEIKLSEVLTSIEGPIGDMKCAKHDSFSKGCCGCVTEHIWAKIYKASSALIESTTLQDLLDMKK